MLYSNLKIYDLDRHDAGLSASLVYNPVISGFELEKSKGAELAGSSTQTSSTGEILAANAERQLLYVQNVGTNVLYVKLGDAPASSGDFHYLLKGGTADHDGNGDHVSNEFYKGNISVTGVAPKYIIWEL